MPKGCSSGVLIKGKCLPKKRLDALYSEFADEMSNDPFIDTESLNDKETKNRMVMFIKDKHPRIKEKEIWAEGLMHIYRTEVK